MLALLGLKELAVGLGSMFPAAMKYYENGFREAWGPAHDDRRDSWNTTTRVSGNASTGAWHMAQGHVVLVTAILTALVAYLTRGRGNKPVLMEEVRRGKLGPKFEDWVNKNEQSLLAHPQLQTRPNNSIAIEVGNILPQSEQGASLARTGKKKNADEANRSGAKLSFDPSLNAVDKAWSVQTGELLASNPVARASYARLQREGTNVKFVNDPNMREMGLFDPYMNEVTVNMLRHSSATEAASTVIHEALHQNRFFRSEVPPGTQFEEYLAFRNEFLFLNARRPTLLERQQIIEEAVKPLYSHLPDGKLPKFGKGH